MITTQAILKIRNQTFHKVKPEISKSIIQPDTSKPFNISDYYDIILYEVSQFKSDDVTLFPKALNYFNSGRVHHHHQMSTEQIKQVITKIINKII